MSQIMNNKCEYPSFILEAWISGGEKQKIALARALLKEADILIFDEAAAHLDKESEAMIEELVRDFFKDRTCLIISHKKWDISGIDRVIQLEEGKIITSCAARRSAG